MKSLPDIRLCLRIDLVTVIVALTAWLMVGIGIGMIVANAIWESAL